MSVPIILSCPSCTKELTVQMERVDEANALNRFFKRNNVAGYSFDAKFICPECGEESEAMLAVNGIKARKLLSEVQSNEAELKNMVKQIMTKLGGLMDE